MPKVMLKHVCQTIGALIMIISICLTGEAAMFSWGWRDGFGLHHVARSTGLMAATHFLSQVWPVLLISGPLFLLGLWLTRPPKGWFVSQVSGGKL